MKWRIYFKSSLLCILFLLIVGSKSYAATEEYHSKSLSMGSYQISNSDWKVSVENQEFFSTISVKNEQQLYQDSIEMGYFSKIHFWFQNNIPYFLIEKRVFGTSGALSFDLFKMIDNSFLNIFSSKEYVKGALSFENGILEVTYPTYKETDSLASPSSFSSDSFLFTNNGDLKPYEDRHPFGIMTNNKRTNDLMSFQSTSTITGINPPSEEINELLTKKALENNIPPEILKAIAFQESDWQQFRRSDEGNGRWKKGDVVIGSDGLGIGIMQVSIPNIDPVIKNKLMTDIEFNIDFGIKILKQKWNYSFGKDGTGKIIIPKINDMNPNIMEHWYFAIMAYNGYLKRNDPNLPSSIRETIPGFKEPYQEMVYNHIRDKGLVNITPFPTDLLKDDIYYDSSNPNRIMFEKDTYQINGPFHETYHNLKKGDVAIVTGDNVNLRNAVGGNVNKVLKKGTILQIAGDKEYENSYMNHFVWYPVKLSNDSQIYYIASSYVKLLDLNDFKVDLTGSDRYATSSAISQYGWKSGADTVILGRGDNPLDALTGTVLAKKHDAPLLLVQTDEVPSSVLKELVELNPSTVYILGGNSAISPLAQTQIEKWISAKVIRLGGDTRYHTAVEVANEIDNVSEIFIATGDPDSPDAMTIGPIAGKHQAPILLSSDKGLTNVTLEYIRKHKLSKIYIIGGLNSVPSVVEKQLKGIGIKIEAIERIFGDNRYETSLSIANRFEFSDGKAFFANAYSFIDALPGASFAAQINAPILLIDSHQAPENIHKWVSGLAINSPKLYFLGGSEVIQELTKYSLLNSLNFD